MSRYTQDWERHEDECDCRTCVRFRSGRGSAQCMARTRTGDACRVRVYPSDGGCCAAHRRKSRAVGASLSRETPDP